MASARGSGLDVITTGAAGAEPAGWMSNGCVLVMLTAGAAAGAGRGRMLIRAVSFFGPRWGAAPPLLSSRMGAAGRNAEAGSTLGSIPGGFGSGCRSGDTDAGGVAGGRRGKMRGASVDGPGSCEEGSGVILGGNRRIGVTGVRDGSTMRAVSRFAAPGGEPACSGRGGSAMRTVSFFGSAISESQAISKSHKPCDAVTCLFDLRREGALGRPVACQFIGRRRRGVPAYASRS